MLTKQGSGRDTHKPPRVNEESSDHEPRCSLNGQAALRRPPRAPAASQGGARCRGVGTGAEAVAEGTDWNPPLVRGCASMVLQSDAQQEKYRLLMEISFICRKD